jgi:glycerol-3-phosphate cytidylyltransferase
MIRGVIAGSFDVIHPGYIDMLKKAKLECDHLTIALHEQPNIERNNKMLCVLTLQERKDILYSIRYVDDVVEYKTETELLTLLKINNFDVRILGDDYLNKDITGKDLCKKTTFVDRSHNWSTTKFKKLIYQNYKDFYEKNSINSM